MTRLVCCCFSLIALFSSAAVAEELQMGVAEIDITPPLGYRMSGYFSERLSDGVLDPLKAKALLLNQGETEVLLVFCDVVAISLDVSERARRMIENELKIPKAHISISATHSHTGPLYFGALREHFHQKKVSETGSDPYESIDYPKTLAINLLKAAEQARQNLQAVTLTAGYGTEDRLAFNRRFHMKNGTVRFNPGYQNPDIVRVAGPIDPEIGLLEFHSAAGKPLAGLVNYALHLDTVGGTKYSADYPFHLSNALQKYRGADYVSLFGTGTCGDINHVDVTQKTRRPADEIGAMLAESVQKALPDLKPVSSVSLAIKSERVNAPVQEYSKEEIEAARAAMKQVASSAVPFLERVRNYKIMALELRGTDTIPLEVQVVRLNAETAIVLLPGEVFVELGMQIKQDSPFETTLVIELTNDAPGYIPTSKAFVEGSYETVNSRIKPGYGEKMAETAIRLLKELK